MAANLVLNHGFIGTLIDGSNYWLNLGMKKYHEKDPELLKKTRFVEAWVTKENVVDLLTQLEVPKEPDLFSLDIDGIDYYVMKAIMDSGIISPRVLVVEYQDILGPTATSTVVYNPQFNHTNYDCWEGPNYCGASLPAFIYLLHEKYAFVGCEAKGFNGFFVRRDCLTEKITLSEMTDISPCFSIPKVIFGMEHRAKRTAHLEWVDVRTL